MESGDNVGLIYGLEFQCRALCTVEADLDSVNFLVGTQGLKQPNQVHWLSLDEESNSLNKRVFHHACGEVWDIASSHCDHRLFSTRHSQVSLPAGSALFEASVWRLEHESESPTDDQLERVCKFGCNEDVNFVSWAPKESDGGKVMILSGNKLALHDIAVAANDSHDGEVRLSKVVSEGQVEGKHGHDHLSSGAWNPHQNCQQFATTNEHHVRGWDIRTMSQVWVLDNPAPYGIVRCIDFNPNKQYYLATSGDDGAIRFWDIRKPSQMLAMRSDHSHWVWSVKYNQFHDQLLLSSSSDGRVILSCMASISSEPNGHLLNDDDDDDDDNADDCNHEGRTGPMEDGVIKTYDDHEDSVYVAVWSSADPWTFASLSYDGRLVLSQVPRKVKFHILNLV